MMINSAEMFAVSKAAAAGFTQSLKDNARRIGQSVAVAATSVAVAAHAAVPAEVTTALGDMKTDALAIGGAVLLGVVAIFAFKFIRKGL